MKKTGIMTDSHSGILSEEAQRLGIKVLPMPFYIGEKVYREGVDFPEMNFMICFEGRRCIYISAVTNRSYGYVERDAENMRRLFIFLLAVL